MRWPINKMLLNCFIFLKIIEKKGNPLTLNHSISDDYIVKKNNCLISRSVKIIGFHFQMIFAIVHLHFSPDLEKSASYLVCVEIVT